MAQSKHKIESQLMPIEHEQLEFKSSTGELRAAIETAAAFATSRGGQIIFGIAPDGSVVGQTVSDDTIKKIANDIRRDTDPPQFPSVHSEERDGKIVIIVTIHESPIKPVWAYGKPYKRVGSTNQSISREETLRLNDLSTGRTWDALVCPDLRMEHLAPKAFTDYLRMTGQELHLDPVHVLENLGLTTNMGICNAANLLFGSNPTRFNSGAQVKCARFRGTTPIDFLDQQTFENTVIDQMNGAFAFIARHTNHEIVIGGSMQRRSRPQYPDVAIREAIVNAVCHRDYLMLGTVQVRIFDNRLEIWNPGLLPPGLSLEQLYREHPSVPKNPKLASALYRTQLMEQWGTGTLRLIRACLANGNPAPEFDSIGGMFVVRLLPVIQSDFDLNDRQKQAIDHVRKIGSITRFQYEEILDVSSRQALRELTELVENDYLTKEGYGKSTRYVSPTVSGDEDTSAIEISEQNIDQSDM